jgi:thiol-disulfide isomerase/thioredoxin/sugar lactone lactonase YvrE
MALARHKSAELFLVLAFAAAFCSSTAAAPGAGDKGKATAAKKPATTTSNPFRNRVELPELPKGMEWFNTKQSISKADLKGKFVLFDFWTYCCINCMHILPELKKLEQRYPKELVVIGVHSAKFETEKDRENIIQAMLRYEVEHLVVNDNQHQLWEFYGVDMWPTLLLVDPEGKVVSRTTGEFKAEDVARLLDRGIAYYRDRGLLSEKPFPIDLVKAADTPLLFPGKVLADEASNRLFISDSNHNRIVVTQLDGKLLYTIGSGAIGRADGNFAAASFDHPQGCALRQEVLYVADTENHLIRKVDLAAKTVKTIAGTGKQADAVQMRIKGGTPKGISLSSPWDLWIHKTNLYVAMAGSHQIWKMPLSESDIGPYAGNGREDIVDGKLLPRVPGAAGYSAFAQPSGLASDGEWLYVADSEGSSIRAVPLDGSRDVATVVGSAHLPERRLFAFGDADGPRNVARLQHCIGVTFVQGALFVADTYNNRIREVNPRTGDVKTLAGTGYNRPGNDDAAGSFDEPAGISHAKGVLYVADTNNHAIRTIDLSSGKVGTLAIPGLTSPNLRKVVARPTFSGAAQEKLKLTSVAAAKNGIALHVSLKLPAGMEINADAPMEYWLDSPQTAGPLDRAAFGKRTLEKPEADFAVTVPVKGAGADVVAVSLNYLYCRHGENGICKAGSVVFTVPLNVATGGSAKPIELTHTIGQ